MLYRVPLPYTSDATAFYAAIADLPWAVWLDSSGRGRYDILAAQPAVTLITQGEQTLISDANGVSSSVSDPFQLLREQLGTQLEGASDVKFAGGALGYWGYDLARRQSHLPDVALDAEQLPEMAIGIYDWALQLDHHQKTAQLVSFNRYPQTVQIIPQILERLRHKSNAPPGNFHVHGQVTSNFTRSSYDTAIYSGAGLFASRRLLSNQSGAALCSTGERGCVYGILQTAPVKPGTLFCVPQSAAGANIMCLARTLFAGAAGAGGNQTDQGYPSQRS